MKLLHSLLLLSAAILCSSAGDPPNDWDDPNPICDGCSAHVTFRLPSGVQAWDGTGDPFSGNHCVGVPIDWTITRDLEISGACALFEGSCVPSSSCLAMGRAVGSVTWPATGGTSNYVVSAGTNQCGTRDVGNVLILTFCASTTPYIVAECDNCDLAL